MMQTTAERIRQRRAQLVVHSYLYYQLDSPIVSDDTWQRWADELATLQSDFDGRVLFYDREFFGWDGSTGMHLPKDAWASSTAAMLLRLADRYEVRTPAEKTPPAAAPQAPAAPAQASLF
jgi:hypothetical protein